MQRPDLKSARSSRHTPWRWELLRIIFPCLASVLLFVIAVFAIFLPAFKQGVMSPKKEKVVDLTGTVWSILDYYAQQADEGVLPLNEAQKRAAMRIRQLRYGPEMKDYFWLLTQEGTVIAHPYRPAMEGHGIEDWDTAQERQIVRDMVTATSGPPHQGFIRYPWQWHDQPSRIVDKLSYVRLFEPWGWIIGTGLYLDDVQADIERMTHRLTGVSLAILGVVTLLALWTIREYITTEQNRVHAVQALSDSETHFRTLVEGIEDYAIFQLTTDGYVSSWNDGARRMFLYTQQEALGSYYSIFYPKLTVKDDVLQQQLEKAREFDGYGQEMTCARNNGDTFHAYVTITPLPKGENEILGFAFLVHDISEYKQAEAERENLREQLHHAQKMEAVGQLAGGIAHDFNNLLTVILGNIEYIRSANDDPEEVAQGLKMIEEAAKQASGITRSLLTFSRKLPSEKKAVNVCELINNSGKLIQRVLPKHVEFHLDVQCPSTLWLHADAIQLQQVLLNLAINARDAIPDKGTIALSAHPVRLSQTGQKHAAVEIVMADTGQGMTAEIQQRVFEPFFTTKPKTKGTGLGLAIAHGIIENHQGHIEIASEEGVGTQVTITLPCSPSSPQTDEPDEPKPEIQQSDLNRRIAIIEDNQYVSQMMSTMLNRVGFEVESKTNCREILAGLDTSSNPWDLLIWATDLSDNQSKECLEQLQRKDPTIPIILITEDGQMDSLPAMCDQVFTIHKPFQFADLIRQVHAIINATTDDPAMT